MVNFTGLVVHAGRSKGTAFCWTCEFRAKRVQRERGSRDSRGSRVVHCGHEVFGFYSGGRTNLSQVSGQTLIITHKHLDMYRDKWNGIGI